MNRRTRITLYIQNRNIFRRLTMHRAVSYLICSFIALPLCCSTLQADGAPPETEMRIPPHKREKSFTGKVTRDRVRMRLSPAIDSPVIREVDRGEMLVVVNEVDDFYAVLPPSNTKGFVYRTYILDGVVEGKKVNVRLDPHLEAPVIAQLNTGDRVEGTISDQNAKWLVINPPPSTLFYISSDFIEKVGDANFLAKHEARVEQVNNLLNSTYLLSEAELQKHFSEIEQKKIIENYQHIIDNYSDFPEQVKQAKKYLVTFNDAYLHKKVEYLESKTRNGSDIRVENSTPVTTEYKTQQARLKELEGQLQRANQTQSASKIYEKWVNEKYASEVNARMALWIPVEIAYYEKWSEQNENRPIQEFYEEQRGQAVALRGILETYDRPVRNKPGDFLLVNKTNRLPIAYLYSSHVNLHEKVGKEITVEGILRPNNNFAYPAYFVIDAE